MDARNHARFEQFQNRYRAAGRSDGGSTEQAASLDAIRGALLTLNKEMRETGHGISNELVAERPASPDSYQQLVMSREEANTNYVMGEFLRTYRSAMSANFDVSREDSLASKAHTILRERSGTANNFEDPQLFRKGSTITQHSKIWREDKTVANQVVVPQQSKLVVTSDLMGPLFAMMNAGSRARPSPRSKCTPAKTAQKTQSTQTLGKQLGKTTTVKTCLNCRDRAGRKNPQKRTMDSDEDEDSAPSKSKKKLANSEKDSFKSAGDVLVRSVVRLDGLLSWMHNLCSRGQMHAIKQTKMTAINSKRRHTVPLEAKVLYRHSTHATHANK
ncbi:hypothetical protein BDZ88DRAFT_129165 [Geranomyces variabilis]|nr:hypothetical protein BDZ88DRAFT_129165 [Geranomyces variabilis]